MTIYLVQAGDNGLIKIGYALNPELRLAKLQSDCPFPARIIALIPGDRSNEEQLHRRFRRDRIRGEWFAPTEAILGLAASFSFDKSLSRRRSWRKGSPGHLAVLIKAFGSEEAIAKACGVSRTAICNWKLRGIPDAQKWKIFELAAKRALPIGFDELSLAEPTTASAA